MSMQRPSSLSTLYFDPESEPVPEPEPIPDPPKRRGRPPGSKNKPKEEVKMKRNIPWVAYLRALSWLAVACVSIVFLYSGIQGWLGQNAADLSVAVSVVVAAVLLDRGGRKMKS